MTDMKLNKEKHADVTKLAYRAFINVIKEHKIEPEETIDIIAMISASMCDCFPNKKEAIAIFLETFAKSLHVLYIAKNDHESCNEKKAEP